MYSNYRQQPQYDETTALGILQHLDTEELQRLLDDDEKLMDLINDLQQVKNIQVDREMLMASNKSLAEFNLSREPVITQGKGELATGYSEAARLRKIFDQDKEQLDFLAAQTSLDTTLALLQTETAKTEEESERIAEQFLDGGLPAEEFVEGYVEKQTLAHMQRIKAEKMAEILQEQQRQQRAAQNQQHGAAANSWGH